MAAQPAARQGVNPGWPQAGWAPPCAQQLPAVDAEPLGVGDMPGACRGGALQLLRPAVGQAICRQPAEALGCCILRLAPAPWLTCTALCPLLGMAMVCAAPCPALLPVPLCVGAVVGVLDCCLACCFGGTPCCCHAALLHAPVGLVGFDVVQLWLLLSGCYAGWRWLAFAVLLPLFITLLPPFLLFCLSISSHLLHVASLVPPSTSCAAVDALLRPLSAGVVCFPLPGWTLH